MNGILLDAAVNGSDLFFGVKDVITLVVGIVGVSTAFITLKLGFKAEKEANKIRFETNERENENALKLLREDLMYLKGNKKAQKVEFMEIIKEKDEMVRARIDKTQNELKDYATKTENEFKEINNTISGVKQDTSEIKGMIQTLLNK